MKFYLWPKQFAPFTFFISRHRVSSGAEKVLLSFGVIAQGISSSYAGYIKSPYKRLNPPSRGCGTVRRGGVGVEVCVTQSFLSSAVNDHERDESVLWRGLGAMPKRMARLEMEMQNFVNL